MAFKSQVIFFCFHGKDDTGEKKITSQGLDFSASTLKDHSNEWSKQSFPVMSWEEWVLSGNK